LDVFTEDPIIIISISTIEDPIIIITITLAVIIIGVIIIIIGVGGATIGHGGHGQLQGHGQDWRYWRRHHRRPPRLRPGHPAPTAEALVATGWVAAGSLQLLVDHPREPSDAIENVKQAIQDKEDFLRKNHFELGVPRKTHLEPGLGGDRDGDGFGALA
jgi:hypothetical protein